MRVGVQVTQDSDCCSDRAGRLGLFIVPALSSGGWISVPQHPASRDDLRVPWAAAIGWDAPPRSQQCCFRPLALALAVQSDCGFGLESFVVGPAPVRAVPGNRLIFGGARKTCSLGARFSLGSVVCTIFNLRKQRAAVCPMLHS